MRNAFSCQELSRRNEKCSFLSRLPRQNEECCFLSRLCRGEILVHQSHVLFSVLYMRSDMPAHMGVLADLCLLCVFTHVHIRMPASACMCMPELWQAGQRAYGWLWSLVLLYF